MPILIANIEKMNDVFRENIKVTDGAAKGLENFLKDAIKAVDTSIEIRSVLNSFAYDKDITRSDIGELIKLYPHLIALLGDRVALEEELNRL